jgi:ribonuclease T2
MSKTTSNPRLPKKGWVALILALLVLAANFILTQIGSDTLPDGITSVAENVVATSVQELQSDVSADTSADAPRATRTSVPPTAAPTAAIAAESDATAPPQAPTTVDDGIWEGSVAQGFDRYVLALSWEPAFCETRSDKEECITQSAGRFDADNFVLHGLWPDDGDRDYNDTSYCDVSQSVISQDKAGDWCDMPLPSLSDTLADDLFVLMPGATSCLHNHEWTKHGTCSELPAEAYYALGTHLVALFSQSEFNAYVAERVGTEVGRNELLNLFETEFGAGSDRYLSLKCNEVQGTSMLSELYITVKPDIDAADSFSELFPDVDVSPQGSCPQRFWIDEVGVGN